MTANNLAALHGITKQFRSLKALDQVDLEIGAGEVVAVVGENGAGKTTLMRVLAGLMEPDAGEVSFRGKVVKLAGARDGIRQGVGFVQQHYGLIDEFSGIENFILGSPDHGISNKKSTTETMLVSLASELGLEVDPRRLVREMTIGEKQRLEILLAVASGAQVLILDEPTAALGPEDAKQLNDIIRRFVANGNAVIYISHKLHDVMAIASRIVVMRKGVMVANYPRENVTLDQVAVDMVGRIVVQPEVERQTPGEIVSSLVNVSLESRPQRKGLNDITFEVRRHEVLGIAGVVGSGQDALAEILAGMVRPDAGAMPASPETVGYVPEDRAGKSIASRLSVTHNLLVHTHRDDRFSKHGRLRWNAMREHAQSLVEKGGVSMADITSVLGSLSGGNQQKIVLIRELERDPDLLVAHNPYRGLDVGAIAAIRRNLIDARDQGTAVVMISSDLDDLFDICDRIIVLCDGEITGEVDPRDTTVREVGLMMAGAA